MLNVVMFLFQMPVALLVAVAALAKAASWRHTRSTARSQARRRHPAGKALDGALPPPPDVAGPVALKACEERSFWDLATRYRQEPPPDLAALDDTFGGICETGEEVWPPNN